MPEISSTRPQQFALRTTGYCDLIDFEQMQKRSQLQTHGPDPL